MKNQINILKFIAYLFFSTLQIHAGLRDFNGDGYEDIIVQHDDGTVAFWYMNGATLMQGVYTSPSNPGSDWRIVSSMDVDYDGTDEILFQKQSNFTNFRLWKMSANTVIQDLQCVSDSGLEVISSAITFPYVWPWGNTERCLLTDNNSILGVEFGGDYFDVAYLDDLCPDPGDYKPAAAGLGVLYFQNSSEYVAFWEVADGLTPDSFELCGEEYEESPVHMYEGGAVSPPYAGQSGWKVVAVSDLNADMVQDIVVQRNDRQVGVWFMNSVDTRSSSSYLSVGYIASGWNIVGPK